MIVSNAGFSNPDLGDHGFQSLMKAKQYIREGDRGMVGD